MSSSPWNLPWNTLQNCKNDCEFIESAPLPSIFLRRNFGRWEVGCKIFTSCCGGATFSIFWNCPSLSTSNFEFDALFFKINAIYVDGEIFRRNENFKRGKCFQRHLISQCFGCKHIRDSREKVEPSLSVLVMPKMFYALHLFYFTIF